MDRIGYYIYLIALSLAHICTVHAWIEGRYKGKERGGGKWVVVCMSWSEVRKPRVRERWG